MTNYVAETLEIIKAHFEAILSGTHRTDWSAAQRKAHIAFYAPYKDHVVIASEQEYADRDEATPQSIYIVVKFGQSAIDFGQVLVPITINAVSEENKLVVCQKLMFDFAETYTQHTDPDANDFVKEVWSTPQVVQNFSEVHSGFRSLMYLSGTFLIGKNSNPLEYLHYIPDPDNTSIYIDVNLITFVQNFDIQPDSQAFYSTNGLVQSNAKIGIYAMNFTCFQVNNSFFDKLFDIVYGNLNATTHTEEGINSRFMFKMKFKGSNTVRTVSVLLHNYAMQQNKADLPMVSLTFMR